MERVRHKFITYSARPPYAHTTKPTNLYLQSMASLFCNAYAGLSYGGVAASSTAASKPRRRMVAVRAEAINPDIRKTEDKVVDSVAIAEIAKPVTAYCRFFIHKIFCYFLISNFNLSWILLCRRLI